MDATTTAAVDMLGPRVRALRTQRGLTLVQLAALSGLSHSFLSQLERSRARPSMSSLESISVALSTSVVELLADGRLSTPGSPVSIVRAHEGVVGAFGSGTGRMLAEGSGHPFRPIEYVGDNTTWGDVVVHDEDEFIHVVDGRIELELDGERHVLGPRDSAYTPGGTGHRWRTADPVPYRLIIVKESSQ
ncbi:helix-turn-helix domain-containing protein [Microbacterium dextranolyticum]|uniref:XRE family transcriptional regulator n=1 Tax=Microbacterium dextranolyticum TaxID=36806 RepID=A0A9W6HMI2_9MICO|nr:XRE family transcriptional regulator [Microbacterium dextranolyticum]MBM7462948.1 mannose-6-phosphate isomerase-like protein (cupin superfamily)/DNA-binding XRE family transcriptional regulator [Microbacterium dextranolyticum]GLJ95946.1 XRE family transcriptional regulator [Microbacterium dextranolyticum]